MFYLKCVFNLKMLDQKSSFLIVSGFNWLLRVGSVNEDSEEARALCQSLCLH